MINLTRNPQPVGPLHASDGIASGNIYVGRQSGPQTLAPDLPANARAVLQTGQGEKLELTTRNQIAGNPGVPGTYLNTVDYNSLNFRADPNVRLYTWRDTFAKIRSGPGIVILLPAILALLTAVAGLFFILSTQGQPSIATVADQAQTIVTWAGQPGSARTAQATACLQLIEGHQLPAVTIPGVNCVQPTTPWWRSTVAGSLITGGIAILAALVGIFGLPVHYGFRKSPNAGN
jgi:hypothetical protein